MTTTTRTASPRSDRWLIGALWLGVLALAVALLYGQVHPARAERDRARALARERAERARLLEEEVDRRAREVRALQAGDPVALREALQREGYSAPGTTRFREAPPPR